jgi:hypothetical protein
VFLNPEKLKAKNFEMLTEADIKHAFGNPYLQVFDDPQEAGGLFNLPKLENKNLVMMSSGNFAAQHQHIGDKILA